MAIIDKPDLHFNTKLYTGNGGTQTITGVGFQPNFVWFKSRDTTHAHALVDSVRGTDKVIHSNTTQAEQSISSQTFNSDGYALVADATANSINSSGSTKVAWNWKAGGTASSNTNGSITSNVSANTTSGFSIVSYTGTAASSATVGHGLNAPLGMVIAKNRDSVQDWRIYHKGLGTNQFINFNTNAAGTASTVWQTASFTNDVFAIGDNASVGGSGNDIIAYCFAEKQGYSKFGSYTGNGSTDGTFVYTGFKPAFVMCRQSDLVNDWWIFDNTRSAFNLADKRLRANTNASEYTDATKGIDLLSNGFKLKSSNGEFNGSGGNYIYMAFAEKNRFDRRPMLGIPPLRNM